MAAENFEFAKEPFYGIKVWDGYNDKTRDAGRMLRRALMQVKPDTGLLPGGEAPQGGHFEGVAVYIGKRS